MGIAAHGYDFVAEVAPREGDILVPKKHPSAFFGTPLASYLVEQGADTVVVTGCTTSGCVRGSVVDAFAYNFRVAVPHDAVYDRSATSHAVNLFDMAEKYADVSDTDELLGALASDPGALTETGMASDIEVLVVGAGACGMAAAIAAHDGGATSPIIEKMERPGGNSSLSTGSVPAAGSKYQKAAGINDTPERDGA